ncbi:MAG: hypothetical protein M3238_05305 [Actinomycetota bacterium]|nr:hypothetical protein [Actinomycetota bacterium]
MKKILTLALAALVAGSLLPSSAQAAKPKQTEEGFVVLPLPYTDDSGCFAGVWRRAHAFTTDAARGPIGWNFAVNKKTWNRKFKLEVSGGINNPDLDIYFYLGPLTTAQDFATEGGDPAPPATISYNTREPGGESGTVPKGAENVIICMYGGQQGAGFNADFTYTAG